MIQTQVRERLQALQSAIAEGDATGVRENMSFLDETLQSHRRELDPQLKHYLKNRSYAKALAFLSGETDIPKGRCGGRTDFS